MTTIIDTPLLLVLLSLVAIVAGVVGVFALMRKMTLAADSMSHVALPGIGLALLWDISPIFGAAVALLFGAWLTWGIERRTGISTDAVIGVLFSASLALGSLFTGGEELLDALFGELAPISFAEWAIGVTGSLVVLALLYWHRDRLTLALVSEDLATASGIAVSRMNFVFLLIFVFTILLGLQFFGALLMGSMIIVPAAVGRNFGVSLRHTFLASVAVAIFSVLAGYAIATSYSLAFGPVVITIAAACFAASLLARR